MWSLDLKYTKNNKDFNFNNEAILELRDRALLLQHNDCRDQSDNLSEEEAMQSLKEQGTIKDFIKFSNCLL